MRIQWGRFLIVVVAVATFSGFVILWFDTTPVEFNISPFARGIAQREIGIVGDSESSFWTLPEAAHDGLFDSLHMYEFDPDKPQTFRLEFPWPINPHRIRILGWGKQKPVAMVVSVENEDGVLRQVKTTMWSARGDVVPRLTVAGTGICRAIELKFSGKNPVVLNELACFIKTTRLNAWTLFLTLQWLVPVLSAVLVILSIMGWARITVRYLPLDLSTDKTATLIFASSVVLLGWFVVSIIWLVCPRHLSLNLGVLTLFAIGFSFQIGRLIRTTIKRNADSCDQLIWWMVGLAAILVAAMTLDSYVLLGRKATPADHLFAYLGAHRLAADEIMPDWLTQRPWLLHVIFAPWTSVCKQFSYQGYIGLMAGLNAVFLPVAWLWFRTWEGRRSWSLLGLLILMPVMISFHLPGQRLLTAGLCLMAVYWWLSETRYGWLLGGISLAVAFLSHPSALFLIPPLACYLTVRCWRRPLTVVRYLSIPLFAYGLWSLFLRIQYPNVRNHLLFYPLMLDVGAPFPKDQTLWQIVSGLTTDHWQQLGIHRLSHLRHYFVTENYLDPQVDRFRYITLPNIMGWIGMIGLLNRRIWSSRMGFVWLALAGPLFFHHLHIGQSNPQLHISPTPMVALSMMAVLGMSGWMEWMRGFQVLAMTEWFLRACYPAMLAWTVAVGSPYVEYYFCSTDRQSYGFVALILPLLWLILMTRTRQGMSRNSL